LTMENGKRFEDLRIWRFENVKIFNYCFSPIAYWLLPIAYCQMANA